MRALLFIVAAIALGRKWHCDACSNKDPPTTTPTTTTTTPVPNLTCLNGSIYKAIVFLVDGSWSMGDGNYGDPPQNRSRDWGLNYNQWQFILGMVDGFRDLIINQFVVVMKQYSSPNYTKECCPTCSTNMTRVLRGEWSDNDWQTASKAVYTQLQNCDTWTYSAVIDTVRVWNQKKNWNVSAFTLKLIPRAGLGGVGKQCAKKTDYKRSLKLAKEQIKAQYEKLLAEQKKQMEWKWERTENNWKAKEQEWTQEKEELSALLGKYAAQVDVQIIEERIAEDATVAPSNLFYHKKRNTWDRPENVVLQWLV